MFFYIDWDINGGACNNIHSNDQNEPKLENFFGRTTTIYNNSENGGDGNGGCGGGDGAGGSLGLSMIKTWLTNQPVSNVDHQENNGNAARGLSLSMNSSTTCDSNKYNNRNNVVQEKTNVDSVDATPKKTIESFGQRTSIYRGVTRFSSFI